MPDLLADRRGALTELEQRYPGLWRAGQLGHAGSLPVCPTGHAALAQELPGGGWPRGAMTELLLAQDGAGELRLLLPALRALAAAGRRVGLVGPSYLPNAAGLAAWGLPAHQLYWVRAPAGASQAARQADMLWAAEQMLRSQAFGGVLAWLPAARPEALRRLQVLAQGGDAALWVLRPATALRESSPAVLRLLLSPLPGNVLSVVFHKRRGPARESPLLLSLDGMDGVPTRHPAVAPQPAVSAQPARSPASTAVSSVVPVVEGGSAHVVLDRGAFAAPVAGRAAAELA